MELIRTKSKPVQRESASIMHSLSPILLFVGLYLLLEIIIRTAGISRTVLPTPTGILVETIRNFGSDIWPHFVFTLKVVVIGFIVATILGMTLAGLFSQYDLIVKAVSPFIILFVVTPMITIVPLFMLWLGFDPNIRILVVILQAAPIIMLNTLSGFTSVETEKLELMRSMGASRRQTFFKLILPNAMPQVFTGIKLGCIFSTIGAISADFVGGSVGLGFRILQYSGLVMTEMTYGTILIVALIGIVLYQLVSFAESKFIVWRKK
ncbi:membrane protein [Brevibacillus reuszeri]|uniref:ABC transporter permease n=1 Tax=Brevibacillus reuszeri TaxID=54915 RepID=UPI001B2B9D98|nr:ABC transporter permease [Brevibacillus reuszeri]GIO10012.1 membrane protein [Brevibacillus reuszeri]